MLRIIISSIKYLARQGLALRRVDDSESNLIQLLQLRAEDDPRILQWLRKSQQKYTSHENQNEILRIMANVVQRTILEKISQSPFITIMVDETTDITNKEQLAFVIRHVDENLSVSEDFLGMYSLLSITADSIVDAIKDILLRFQIPFTKVRGQCYDGCSTMAGKRNGVATKIQNIEPRAVFTHCYGHALNLSISDTIKHCSIMKDCLDTCYELIKLVKFSPKREAMLNLIKEETGVDSVSLRTLCPTRWTVRAESLASILANYSELQILWDKAISNTSDTQMKARIRGIASQMTNFRFLFGLLLSEMVLRHSDKLSQTLQSPDMSSVEGKEVAMLTVETLRKIRSDSDFNLFWQKVEKKRVTFDVDEAQLPRKRKVPNTSEVGKGEGTFPSFVADFYRQIYFEVLDLATSCITDRFDQEGYKIYSNIEQLLLKAVSNKSYEQELAFVKQFYQGDLDADELASQIQVFQVLYSQKATSDKQPTIKLLHNTLQDLSTAQARLLDCVIKAFKILLVIPATNCTSERSFSALRRIKTYLRSTMTQSRVNHLMMLNYHQNITDQINIEAVANDFIKANSTRLNIFALF